MASLAAMITIESIDPTILNRLIEDDPTLTSLTLNDQKLGAEVGKAVADALKINRSLQQLKLYRNNFSAKGGKALAEALKVNCSLQQLDLSDNSLGTEGVSALADALKVNCSLQRFGLGSNAFGAEGGTALAEALKINRTLLQLDLSRNALEAEGGRALAEALKINYSLQQLDIGGDSSLGAEGGKALAEALKVNRSLQQLNLRNTALDAEGGKALAKALKVNHSLQHLDLGHNVLGAEGGEALAKALKVNDTLLQLDLRWNAFGTEGGKALAGALKVNRALQQLDLGRSTFGTEVGKALAEALKLNRSLQYLDLYDNNLGAEAGKALAEAVKINKTLTFLGYGSTNISKNNAQIIDVQLALNKQRAEKRAQESKEKATKNPSLPPSIPSGSVKTQAADSAKVEHSFFGAPTYQQLHERSPAAGTSAQADDKWGAADWTDLLTPTASPSSLPAVKAAATKTTQKTARSSLDAAAVQQLKALDVHKLQALSQAADKLQTVDWASLQALQGSATQLQRLLDSDVKAEHTSAEQKRIAADPNLATYHRYFVRLLTGTWLACQTISSGLVENSEKYTSDRVGQGLDAIGKHLPVISVVTSLFSGVISTWNNRERRQGVQKIAMLFPNLTTAFRELDTLARQVTLAQEAAIKQVPPHSIGFVARAKEHAQNFKAAILADDVDTPVKRKAIGDCEVILTAIRDERPCPHPTVADLLTILMGPDYVYAPSPQPSPSPPALTPTPSRSPPVLTATPPMPSPAPSSPSMSMEEMIALMQQQAAAMKQLQERDEVRERELKALRQRMSPQDDETVIAGDNEAQAQVSTRRALNRRNVAASHNAQTDGATAWDELDTMKAEGAHTRARVDEHDDKLAAIAADLSQVKKKGRKGKCLVM